MYICEICGSTGDIHHIVHKSEGGFDFELNYKYLCEKHHRGAHGPHSDVKTDLIYKLDLQNKLYKLLPKPYYTTKELLQIINLSPNALKRLVKDLKNFKEGYSKESIILKLMGGIKYTDEMLRQLELEDLFAQISIS